MPPWKLRVLREQARGWDDRGLATAIVAVAQADADVKGAAGGRGVRPGADGARGHRGARPAADRSARARPADDAERDEAPTPGGVAPRATC